MSFPKYPEYKDSGVEWLGEVPAHWGIVQTKRLFQIVGGSTPKSDNDSYWDGDIVWITPADLSQLRSFEILDSARRITADGLASCGTTMIPKGSIVLSTRAPIGSLGISDVELCTNQGCKCLIAVNELDSRFYAHMFSIASTQLNIRGKGTTFLELSGDALAAFELVYPPHQEQSAIAAFLDRETAKIDALVTEQEKLIELLKEKRQAVISHAVTKGLDPNVPMKDSGVEWLGEVPEHWAVHKLGHKCLLQGGYAFASESFCSDGTPIVRMNNLSRGSLNLEEAVCIPADCSIDKVSLNNGDLIWGMSGSIGDTGSLGNFARVRQKDIPCQLNQRVGRFLPKDSGVSIDFLEWLIQSKYFYEQILLLVTGTAQFNVSSNQVESCIVSLPPQDEQYEIVLHLAAEVKRLEDLQAEAQRAIDLLKERRSALISAAVTGKIDVRGLAEATQ